MRKVEIKDLQRELNRVDSNMGRVPIRKQIITAINRHARETGKQFWEAWRDAYSQLEWTTGLRFDKPKNGSKMDSVAEQGMLDTMLEIVQGLK